MRRSEQKDRRPAVVFPAGTAVRGSRAVECSRAAMLLATSLRGMSTESHAGMVERLVPFRATIFAEMSALAVAHDAINLGQGFPDTDGPASMLAAAVDAINDGQKCKWPRKVFMCLPVALGYQWYTPAKRAKITPGATT